MKLALNLMRQSAAVPLTLGTAQLGLPYGIANRNGQPDEELAAEILDAAIAGGITCFDTASMYGSSEEVLGNYFHGKKQELIISKLYLILNDETTAGELERQIEEAIRMSQQRLQMDCIPVVLLHQPFILSRFGRKATEILYAQVKRGNIGRLGISIRAFDAREFADLWGELQNDAYEFIQMPMNVLDQRIVLAGAYGKLQSSGKLLFARSIYLQGLFFLSAAELPDHLQAAKPWLDKLHRFAEREGMTAAELAFSYIRHMPGIFSTIFGAETPEQVKLNIGMLQIPPLQESTVNEIGKVFAQVPEYIVTPFLWQK